MVRHLNIVRLRRVSRDGEIEELAFRPGLNLIAGPPNAGKSQWVRMLDHLLGDPEPFEDRFAPDISDKYVTLEADITIGRDAFLIRRDFNRKGMKTKVRVDDKLFDTTGFQQWLLEQLRIPPVAFPKGLTMNLAQQWPELSFRTLYRHIYRQQRFWGDLADKQPMSESNACLLQFLGLASRIFSKDTQELRELRAQSDRKSTEIHTIDLAIDAVVARPAASRPMLASAGPRATAALSDLLDAHGNKLMALTDQALSGAAPAQSDLVLRLVETALEMGALSERNSILCDLVKWRGEAMAEFERLSGLISDLAGRIHEDDIAGLIDERSRLLTGAMNEYLDILNTVSNKYWRHSDIRLRMFRRNELSLCVGSMLWSRALGGTDSLLFLMAYHYGLLALSKHEECHYPGFLIVDLPAYFDGETVSHMEAQMIAPFADLVARDAYKTCQVIFIGASFQGETRGNQIAITGSHLH